ncbi:TIGR03619 family F420-dependent LLM class oxidoreductase [Streptomyces sp. WAC07061]|uniref:TIGR03619 family F420-dependent LLM class oxidoreductase n=1 Tax=Streptomyces sp. WAC07061 TaxID=2487410 RepID=UPI000F7A76B5|nr:TIGR03619 family F420-dependent LLM class oxidoreductase [Streptomyces sp. WAC07061]RSS44116.1 TIGR03619 family F420-dependent LLM class oxidoreductase [Streptomyces sp. WAC07061]
MRIGFSVPQFGPFADPHRSAAMCTALEALGCDSLWVADRLLSPLVPPDGYAGGKPMPSRYGTHLDPLLALGAAAAATGRVRLGSSTLNALWQPPLVLARSLTTLDLISRGRLDVGIGLGWMREEYEAAGVPWRGRGARLEETLDVLEAVWRSGTVVHDGRLWRIAESTVLPQPLQRPRPPVLLGGFTPFALERIGRRADGWLAAAMPVPHLRGLWAVAVEAAERAGRDPAVLRRVFRVNAEVTTAEAAAGETHRRGTVRQICDHLRLMCTTDTDEVLVDLQLTTDSAEEYLALAAEFVTELNEAAPGRTEADRAAAYADEASDADSCTSVARPARAASAQCGESQASATRTASR